MIVPSPCIFPFIFLCIKTATPSVAYRDYTPFGDGCQYAWGIEKKISVHAVSSHRQKENILGAKPRIFLRENVLRIVGLLVLIAVSRDTRLHFGAVLENKGQKHEEKSR